MSLHRLIAVARKEVKQILRDPRSLAIVVLMPVILMLLFGYGINLDLKHTPTYVFDREHSPQSRDLISRFYASSYFRVVREVDNYDALVAALDAGRCKLAFVNKYLYRCFRVHLKRQQVHRHLDTIRKLRNRVAHHESILARNLMDDFSRLMQILHWICPDTAVWVRGNSTLKARYKLRPTK